MSFAQGRLRRADHPIAQRNRMPRPQRVRSGHSVLGPSPVAGRMRNYRGRRLCRSIKTSSPERPMSYIKFTSIRVSPRRLYRPIGRTD